MLISKNNLISEGLSPVITKMLNSEPITSVDAEYLNNIDITRNPCTRLYMEEHILRNDNLWEQLENLEILKDTQYWNSKIEQILIPMGTKTYTIAESITMFLNHNFLQKRRVNLSDQALDALIDNTLQYENDALINGVINFCIKKLKFSVIIKKYEVLKPHLIKLSPDSTAYWLQYLIKYGKQVHVQDMADQIDYKNKLINIFNELANPKLIVNVGSLKTSQKYQWMILARSIENKIDKKEDYEGDLNDPQLSFKDNIRSIVELFKIHDPKSYLELKNLYLGNTKNEIINNIKDNPMAAGAYLKTEQTYLAAEEIESSIPETIRQQEQWIDIMGSTYNWPVYKAAFEKLENLTVLIKLGLDLHVNKYKTQPSYESAIECYLRKLYNANNIDKEHAHNHIEYIVHKYFKAKDVELFLSLGIRGWKLYDAVYTSKYLNLDATYNSIEYEFNGDTHAN